MDVAEACSGLRSLIALCALIVGYAYVVHRKNWHRWVLCFCSAPIAIAANAVRVMMLVLVAVWLGTDDALRIAHDLSGYVVFVVAVVLMVGISRQLERVGRRDAVETEG